jgi:hypothetical protein
MSLEPVFAAQTSRHMFRGTMVIRTHARPGYYLTKPSDSVIEQLRHLAESDTPVDRLLERTGCQVHARRLRF